VNGPHNTGFNGLHGVILIMNGRCGTCQIVYLVHFQKDGINEVMSYDLEMLVIQEMKNILFLARIIVVQADK
jgi:hypothetical protein